MTRNRYMIQIHVEGTLQHNSRVAFQAFLSRVTLSPLSIGVQGL